MNRLGRQTLRSDNRGGRRLARVRERNVTIFCQVVQIDQGNNLVEILRHTRAELGEASSSPIRTHTRTHRESKRESKSACDCVPPESECTAPRRCTGRRAPRVLPRRADPLAASRAPPRLRARRVWVSARDQTAHGDTCQVCGRAGEEGGAGSGARTAGHSGALQLCIPEPAARHRQIELPAHGASRAAKRGLAGAHRREGRPTLRSEATEDTTTGKRRIMCPCSICLDHDVTRQERGAKSALGGAAATGGRTLPGASHGKCLLSLCRPLASARAGPGRQRYAL